MTVAGLWEWGCEECPFHCATDKEAWAHCDTAHHSLAIRPARRQPEIIICCWVGDPDPACTVEPGHVLGKCIECQREVRIGPSSVKAIFDHGAQPWCIQCFAKLAPETVEIRRRRPE